VKRLTFARRGASQLKWWGAEREASHDYAGTKTLTLGGRNGGSRLLNADIADLYTNWGTYLNPATELSKFRNPSTGKPVDLGANGARPTGASPIGLFSGPGRYLAPKQRHRRLPCRLAGGLTASSSNP
jgi:hypothetical protein